ncbi:MAG: HD domain-containing phosphohydrolase [Anaerolineales bacterium]
MTSDTIRALLIEDDPDDVLLLKGSLTKAKTVKIRLGHADCLSSGLIQLAEQDYDVILLDLNLPDSRGLETLTTIIKEFPKMPVVVLSGLADEATTSEAVKLGAQDFLVKGDFNISMLVRVLNYAIERKQATEDILRQLNHLAALREIDRAITGSTDMQLALNKVLVHTATQLGIDAADILLLDPHTQVLEYCAGRGFRTEALQHTHLRLGDSYAGRAALDRKIVHIPDLQGRTTDFLRSPTFSQEGFVCYFGIPLIAKSEVKGVLEVFHRSALNPDAEWLDFLETLAGQAALAIDNSQMFDNLKRSNLELMQAYDATIEGWSKAMDLRDRETEGHTLRVTELTVRLARTMGLSEADIIHFRRGALLHDMGKLGVPDDILFNPATLTEEEWAIIKQHPQFVLDMLSPIAYLRPALDIPYCHHEKWDGTGYPRGLKGEQIPLAARIFSVVDVWDALLSDRPYRVAWPREKVLDYIREQSGRYFDPEIVNIFLRLVLSDEHIGDGSSC